MGGRREGGRGGKRGREKQEQKQREHVLGTKRGYSKVLFNNLTGLFRGGRLGKETRRRMAELWCRKTGKRTGEGHKSWGQRVCK